MSNKGFKYSINTCMNSEVKVLTEYRTKREVESAFNKLIKSFKKSVNSFVEEHNFGYAKVTTFGSLGMIECGYYIHRNY